MTEQEIKDKLLEIRSGMTLMDSIINHDFKGGRLTISEKQAEIVSQLFKLFEALNWQIAFNSYRELKHDDSKAIKTDKCGTPVKVRSCRPEHGEKTYFGILIGQVSLSVGHRIENGIVTSSHSFYNPAIFVPELCDIVYGYESWWGEIASEAELHKLITNETIRNGWYVKILSQRHGNGT